MSRIQVLAAVMAIAATAMTTPALAQTPANGSNPTTGSDPLPTIPQPSEAAPAQAGDTPEPVTAAPTLTANCDTAAQICFDDRGPSPELTRQYFGDAAANSLQQSFR